MEVEARGATVLFRALPLRPRGRPSGALVLVRDVTEVRRRDRALLTKDATIREIHHRVKNNLQTVAALLRLQARRIADPEARQALQRVGAPGRSIALVHETLSHRRRTTGSTSTRSSTGWSPMISDVAAAETRARVRRVGSFGESGRRARHAAGDGAHRARAERPASTRSRPETGGGQVTVDVDRSAKELDIVVSDDGVGCPRGSPWSGRPGSACRSSARWSTPSCSGPSRCATGRVSGDRGADRGAVARAELSRELTESATRSHRPDSRPQTAPLGRALGQRPEPEPSVRSAWLGYPEPG